MMSPFLLRVLLDAMCSHQWLRRGLLYFVVAPNFLRMQHYCTCSDLIERVSKGKT